MLQIPTGFLDELKENILFSYSMNDIGYRLAYSQVRELHFLDTAMYFDELCLFIKFRTAILLTLARAVR